MMLPREAARQLLQEPHEAGQHVLIADLLPPAAPEVEIHEQASRNEINARTADENRTNTQSKLTRMDMCAR